MTRRTRIGIFGGTFDPPHMAHLIAAERAAEELGTERMLLVVANDPWQKTGEQATGANVVTDAATRLRMVAAAADRSPLLEPCDIELRRGGPSYSVDTLRELARQFPEADLHLVLGTDALAGLSTWKEPEEVRALCSFAVLSRPGHAVDRAALEDGDVVVPVPSLEVSSSDLRRRVADGLSVRYLVPDPVIALISEHGLYRGGR